MELKLGEVDTMEERIQTLELKVKNMELLEKKLNELSLKVDKSPARSM